MDSDLLKTFLVLTRTRHFGRAAESLFLTQSAVSFRIKQLEEQLGEELFIRHRNNIQLTVAGEQFIDYAEQLLALWQQARQVIVQKNQTMTELHIGASGTIWQGYLMEKVNLLTTWIIHRYWATRFNLAEYDQHQLDILISLQVSKQEEWQNQFIGQLDFVLCYQPAVQEDNIYWAVSGLMDNGKNPSVQGAIKQVVQVVDVEMAYQSLQQRGGYAYLPTAWLSHAPSLQVIEAQGITCPLYANWRKNSSKQAIITQFIAHILN